MLLYLWKSIPPSGKYLFSKHLSLKQFLGYKVSCRSIQTDSVLTGKIYSQIEYKDNTEKESVPELVEYLSDKRIIYSSYISSHKILHTYGNRRKIEERIKAREIRKRKYQSVPLVIERLISRGEGERCETVQNDIQISSPEITFPYSHTENIHLQENPISSSIRYPDLKPESTQVQEDIAYRMHAYEQGILSDETSITNELNIQSKYGARGNPDSVEEDYISKNSGTADVNVPVSSVPCGGCGALLHCQEPALPGIVWPQKYLMANIDILFEKFYSCPIVTKFVI